jgi:tryptophan 7-halogenase
MSSERAIRTIAVAGGGIVGLSASTAFARALPGTQVTLIQTAPDPAALADLMPAAGPGVARFHAALGLSELELVRAGIATHRLGTTFEAWSANGDEWTHAFGAYGKPACAIPFDQVWCRARRAGAVLAYDRYSIGAALARAGKFMHPARDPASLGSRVAYGLRFDPALYRERLAHQAAASGVSTLRLEIREVERNGDALAALLLADGSRVEADLFIDCTGPSACLIRALEDSFEDWSEWLPFDRLLLTDEQPISGVPAPADRAQATDEGWSGKWPLRMRTLCASLRIGGSGIVIARGRWLRPWVRNVLAVGDSATALDPLHGFNLDMAHAAILLALELLPGRDFNPVETEEYNRRAEQLTRRVRDFLVLHYLRSGRVSGVWRDFAQRQPPDSLARTLDQFGYRGRLPFHEEEMVTRDSWTAALLGMGVLPAHVDPHSAGVPLDKAVPAMRELAREIEASAARAPGYSDYLRSMTG